MKRYLLLCLLAVVGLSSCKGFETVPADEFEARIADGKAQLVDVRTREEYYAGYIPGAINIDSRLTIFPDLVKTSLDPAVPVAVYCRSGRRSKEAAQKLADLGYSNVYEFGGIIDWEGPVTK